MKSKLLFRIRAKSATSDKAELVVGIDGKKHIRADIVYDDVTAIRDYLNILCDSWKAAKDKRDAN
jgi:hypothetical protein